MWVSLPTSLQSHGGTDTRVDHDPDPGQGQAPVAGRRDIPRVVVAVHLRPGMPGRIDRTGAGADPWLLFLRRVRVREEGQEEGREARRGAPRDRVAVQEDRLEARRVEERGRR